MEINFSKLGAVFFVISLATQYGICDDWPASVPRTRPAITVSSDMSLEDLKGRSHEFDFVEFKDSKGNLKFRLANEDKTVQENGKEHSTGRTIFFENKYFLSTEYDRKDSTSENYFNTGLPYESHNTIEVYDLQGNILFQQKDVPYKLAAISDNGKVVACVNEINYLNADGSQVSEKIENNPPKSEIFVFSTDGKLLYHSADQPISKPTLSPSGDLLAYGTVNPSGNVKIVDLSTKKEYWAPRLKPKRMGRIKMDEESFNGISDDGTLFNESAQQYKKMPDGSLLSSDWERVDLWKLKR